MTRYVLHTRKPAKTRLDLEGKLNEQQFQAVVQRDGPILVIAGAGSGKTRTLTYRAAHLISSGMPPERILLCTFTNRAAREMIKRVEGLLDAELKPMWAGTFHHVANIALRRHAEQVGLPPNYAILDSEDSQDLMASCLAEEGKALRSVRFPRPRLLQHMLSRAVDSQIPIDEAIKQHAFRFRHLTEEIQRVVERFVARKLQLGLVDYDDLLLFFKILLTEHKAVAAELTARFEQVLVDEYQDTSLLQGELMDLCAAHHGNLCVVGDDAQSIYSFRGAHFQNIIDFPKRYPSARVFKLETNYRSTPEILQLANAAIALNKRQYPKVLRPVKEPGVMPALIPLRDAEQQAAFVAQRVLQLHQEEGLGLKDIAVLYRAHSHSLELQVELHRRQIPFTVRSGMRFFEQAHIKDVTAYLRLAHNPGDALAWQRVLGLWSGVGRASVDHVLRVVEGEDTTRDAAELLADEQLRARLPGRARPAVKRLARLMARLAEARQQGIPEMIDAVLAAHYKEYATARFPNADTRIEDLEQLAAYTSTYEADLERFLSELALVAGIAAEGVAPGEPPEEKMVLSTVHQAKGLEWRAVFVIALSEGCFPGGMSVRTEEDVEEERRLFHVAVTRAEEQLYMCHPQFQEQRDGMRHLLRLSRFVAELPEAAPTYERWEIEERPEEEEDAPSGANDKTTK